MCLIAERIRDMKKIKEFAIDLSFKLNLEQIKELAQTPVGDISAVREALGAMLIEALNHPSARVQPYIKWLPHGHFDDEDYDWFWKKYDESPFRNLAAMQELAQHQYGVLDRLADI